MVGRGNPDFFLAFIVVLAVVLLLAGDFWLLQSQAQQRRDLQVVKNQLAQSKSALIEFPVSDPRSAVVFSLAALVIGAAAGFCLGRKTTMRLNRKYGFGRAKKDAKRRLWP